MKRSTTISVLASVLFFITGSLCVAAQEKMNSKMPSDQDKNFASMAAMGGQAEVQLAQLALEKSTNKDVRNFASKMIKDHTKSGKDLEKEAMKNNVTLPTMISDDQTQMLSQLQQASTADFDRMYIQMAGIDAHNKMEEILLAESANGSDKDFVNFARNTIPTVQDHLQMAQDVMAKLNK